MEFQKKATEFAEKGISIIAISYDPVDVLKAFSDKYSISYPLLSDANSEIIKKYGILNTELDAGSRNFGIPNPGIYFINEAFIVQNKQFEKSYTARPSAESILAVHLDKEIDAHIERFKTSYLAGSIAISDTLSYPGQILTVVVKFSLQNNIHLYAKPIPQGFIPLTIDLASPPGFTLDPFPPPPSRQLTIASLEEVFNVVSKEITLTSSVRVDKKPPPGQHLLEFSIRFQACDDQVCFPPETLSFQFPVTITRKLD